MLRQGQSEKPRRGRFGGDQGSKKHLPYQTALLRMVEKSFQASHNQGMVRQDTMNKVMIQPRFFIFDSEPFLNDVGPSHFFLAGGIEDLGSLGFCGGLDWERWDDFSTVGSDRTLT